MDSKEAIEPTQYLTFKLDREIYALEISQVREVLDFTEITKVPGMPGVARGIINLRDNTVPVVDLKLKFNRSKTEKSLDTCIIIIEFNSDKDRPLLGILADSVQEVLSLEPGQLDSPAKMGDQLKSDYIKGIGKKDKEFIIILDLEKVFSPGEIGEVFQDPLPLPSSTD